MNLSVRVPGSLMLMGEHAVLHGELAIALATDKFIYIELHSRSDRQVLIDSELAQYSAELEQLSADSRLSFVLAAIEQQREHLPGGFKLCIRSEFSHEVGLGSSAAVTAGVVAALSHFCGETLTHEQLFERSLGVVHRVQGGRGSGTDLVASIFGGLVAYRVRPREIRRMPGLPPIDLFYVGYKMKTPDVIARVEALASGAAELYQGIYRLMGEVSEAAEAAIVSQQWTLLGQLMNCYAGLMDALGVCDQSLADLQYRLRTEPEVLGAKISGSGLGDSVICLGKARPESLDYTHIPVAISQLGLIISEKPTAAQQGMIDG
ncbi:MAG TPA: GHMP kinase [Marinobacterium sp.]|nr:GHMP kinase [Marinobacterium sp.]